MKRLKKTLRWLEVSLIAFAALVLLTNACLVWITEARINRALAALRRVGDPTSLAELAPRPIPPDQNADTYLRQAKAEATAIYAELQDISGTMRRSADAGVMPPAVVLAAVRQIVAAHPRAIPLIERAAACPDYDPQLNFARPPMETLSEVVHSAGDINTYTSVLLYARATPLAAEGNRDEALRTILLAFRLTRHFDRHPMIMPYLIAIRAREPVINLANVILQAGPVSREVRGALDAELALQDRTNAYDWAVRSQRACFLDEFETIDNCNDWFISRILRNQQKLDCLDTLQFYLARARDPSSYQRAAQIIENTPVKAWGVGGGTLPVILVSQRAVAQMRAKLRSLRLLNAVQAHVVPDQQTLSLANVGLPVEAMADPFTGELLHVKRLPQGWLVYSVGVNYRDDAGRWGDRTDDVGVGPWRPVATSNY